MAKDPWMANYPLGDLGSNKPYKLNELSVLDRRKRQLLEDYKSGIIDKAELSRALISVSQEDENESAKIESRKET